MTVAVSKHSCTTGSNASNGPEYPMILKATMTPQRRNAWMTSRSGSWRMGISIYYDGIYAQESIVTEREANVSIQCCDIKYYEKTHVRWRMRYQQEQSGLVFTASMRYNVFANPSAQPTKPIQLKKHTSSITIRFLSSTTSSSRIQSRFGRVAVLVPSWLMNFECNDCRPKSRADVD